MLEAHSTLTVASEGKPLWFWAIVIIGLLAGCYAIYYFFIKEPPQPDTTNKATQ